MAKKPGQPHLREVQDCGRDLRRGAPYKSGRISSLGTPDISSSCTTRSAGIPFFRHLYSDCEVMPQASVTALYPPPPSSIRSSRSAMAETLQPKAGKYQQPEAVFQPHSILGVKSPAKIEALRQFGERLNEIMQAKNFEAKKRPEELRLLLKKHGVEITYETTRSWLSGEKGPGSANQQILCKALGANFGYLFHGDGEIFVTDPNDDDLAEIQRSWGSLSPEGRDYMIQSLNMARKAQRAPQDSSNEKPQKQRSDKDEKKQSHSGRRSAAR